MVLKRNQITYPYLQSNRTYTSNTVHLKYNFRYNRKKKMNDLPVLVDTNIKPKVILFYKNGDRNFRGYHVTVTPRRFRNFDNLLNELTRVTNLSQGARYIFTPQTGTRVENLESLSDGKAYVCGSYPKLKKIKYGCRPDGSDKKKNINKSFIPASAVTAPTLQYDTDRANFANLKPKIITVIRNGRMKPCKTVKILLNRKTAQTYEQVLNDVTSAVGVEGGFGIRKLFTVQGKLILTLSELFEEGNIFIAVGNEKFKAADVSQVLDDSGFTKSTPKTTKPKPLKSISPAASLKSVFNINNKNKSQKSNALKKLPEIKSKRHQLEESVEKVKSNEKNDNKFEPTKVKDVVLPLDELKADHVTLDDHDIIHSDVIKDLNESNHLDNDKDSNFNDNQETLSNKGFSVKSESDEKESISSSTVKSSEISDDKTEKSESDEKESLISNTVKSSEISVDNETKTKIVRIDENDEATHAFLSKESTMESKKDSDSSDDEESNQIKPEYNMVLLEKIQVRDSDTLSTRSSVFSNKSVLPGIRKSQSKKIESSNIMKDFYDIGKILGDGNFAVVKEAVDKQTKKKYALKIIDGLKLEGKEEMLENEIKVQGNCFHPNIVQLFYDYHAPAEIFLVMELVSGGDFFDLISENVRFDEEEASLYMRDLCSGLDYLHQRKIVHRDIKPENLMVFESPNALPMLKIADFGLAMKIKEPIFTICGTPTYVAPEILTEKGYGLEVDVWASGVIVYIMLCGFPPFRSPNRQQTELFDLIEAGHFEYLAPYWDDITELAKDLINNILNVDVSKRYTAAQILNHKWLTQFGLTRNNTTLMNIPKQPRTNQRFKAAVRSIQSINRMKHLAESRLQRDEHFDARHVTRSEHSGSAISSV